MLWILLVVAIYLAGVLALFVFVFAVLTICLAIDHKEKIKNRAHEVGLFAWWYFHLPERKIPAILAYWGLGLFGNVILGLAIGVIWPFAMVTMINLYMCSKRFPIAG